MLTQQQLLDQMGRLLAEATPDFFDASVRLLHLNAAYGILQARVVEIAPELFTFRALASIAIGTDGTRARYLRADMSPNVSRVVRYDILAGTRYVELPLVPESQTVPILGDAFTFTDGQQRSTFGYFVQGTEIVIVPTPPADVTDGLQAICIEQVVLAGATDTPRLPGALHPLIAIGGALYAVEESKDVDESIVSIWRRRWESVVGPGDSSSDDSRRALRKHFRRSQTVSLVGMRLG